MKPLRLLTKPSGVEVIASGRGITARERQRLDDAFTTGGGARWRKLKGRARVELVNGKVGWAEVHWYDAQGIGPVDHKIKRMLETET